MLTETAEVIAVEEHYAIVSASVKTACSQCQVNDDCGTNALAKALTPRSQQLRIKTTWPVAVGDTVIIGIPQQRVLLASLLLYALPIVTLLTTSLVLTQFTDWHELAVFVSAIAVTAGSVLTVRRYFSRRPQQQFEPVLIRTVASPVTST